MFSELPLRVLSSIPHLNTLTLISYFVDNISLQLISVSLIHQIFLHTNNRVRILQSVDVSIS